jgi:hypothetical protein
VIPPASAPGARSGSGSDSGAGAPRPRRQGAGPSGPGKQGGSRGSSAWFLPAVGIVALLLVVGIGFGSGVAGGGSEPAAATAAPGATAGGATAPVTGAGPTSDPGTGGQPAAPSAEGEAQAEDDPAAEEGAAPAALVEADVPIVPVTNFRSARTSVKAGDVAAIADGNGTYKGLVLLKADADPILAALGLDRSAFGSRLATVKSPRALQQHLSDNRAWLGFLRADQVDPSVRALAWGAKSLFGNDRVKSLARWPLTARLQAPEGAPSAYDPAAAWTLVAGGDILLDRGVSLAINEAASGADFPFNGGTVNITGRCRDCSPMGWDLPYTTKTGNAGIVRELLSEADLSIANFENPAPDDWRFHGSGMMFSADPKHIKGLVDAGLDWVSLANNHMGDSGDSGILQTMKNLDKYGLAHGGAGANTKQAHKATLLEAGGITVGILGYDSIAGYYKSTATSPGTSRLSAKALVKDIAAARKAGADLVIVFPHWGIEYREKPSQYQVDMGRAAIDAGADMVIGNHPHWVEGMEVYKGKPIWYALGNFVFDQSWSEYTMEGITLELTLQGTDLRQIGIRPHLIMGKAQPNLMDPATAGGKFVMDQFWRSSKGHLDW